MHLFPCYPEPPRTAAPRPTPLYSLSRTKTTDSMMPRNLGGAVDPKPRVCGTKDVKEINASVIPPQTIGDRSTALVYTRGTGSRRP
ncbi:alcohol oxidase [Apiospora hydei]|uniref:Alcohol oxidase n=1 Tax=Apiospora hydei TaxID=1337664 RepID=A0ABR1X7Y2_9PEZI